MDELVQRLSIGDHPIEVRLSPEQTSEQLRLRLERGYVHVRFTDTRGGTELGIELDRGATDLSAADFAAGRGRARLVGRVVLNFEPVRCIADIDLATLSGAGRLEPLDSR